MKKSSHKIKKVLLLIHILACTETIIFSTTEMYWRLSSALYFLAKAICIWPLLQFYADFTIIIFLLFQCHCSTSKKICGNGCHWDCKRRSHNYHCTVCWVLRTYCQPCQLSQIIWLSLDCQGHTMSSWLHFELSKG